MIEFFLHTADKASGHLWHWTVTITGRGGDEREEEGAKERGQRRTDITRT